MFDWLKRRKDEGRLQTEEVNGSEFGFAFPIVKLHGRDALKVRQEYLGRAGVTPIIMGAPEDLDILRDGMSGDDRNPDCILEQAKSFPIDEWVQKALLENPDIKTSGLGRIPRIKPEKEKLTTHLKGISRQPKSAVIIGLFPTSNSWEVPAHVKYGGWNSCPETEVHIALHQKWNSQYGAEIACLSGDIIECTVKELPKSPNEALELAVEQALYCPDLIYQGVGSLENLVALLMCSRSWHFWWD